MKPLFRVIGDVHGRYVNYIKACKEAEKTVQIGDLLSHQHLFDACYNGSGLDSKKHNFFGGNHDNYDDINNSEYNLGDYGYFEVEGVGLVFFVRGAFSIDHKTRNAKPITLFDEEGYISGFLPKDFWEEKEQLTTDECAKCLELYKTMKPDIILSHECPFFFLNEVTNPWVTKKFGYDDNLIKTNTNLLLDDMHKHHAPKYHLFGHYHHWKSKKVNQTTLVCIPIMGAVDFYPDKIVPINIGYDRFSHEITKIAL